MHWTEKEYAYYRGEKNICDGTITEIAEVVGMGVRNVQWLTTPTYKNRIANRRGNRTMRLVPIIDENRSLMTYRLSDDAIDALSDAEVFTVGDLMTLHDDRLALVHPNKVVVKEIARYLDWFVEVEQENECEESI